jgi:hypothetical protein
MKIAVLAAFLLATVSALSIKHEGIDQYDDENLGEWFHTRPAPKPAISEENACPEGRIILPSESGYRCFLKTAEKPNCLKYKNDGSCMECGNGQFPFRGGCRAPNPPPKCEAIDQGKLNGPFGFDGCARVPYGHTIVSVNGFGISIPDGEVDVLGQDYGVFVFHQKSTKRTLCIAGDRQEKAGDRTTKNSVLFLDDCHNVQLTDRFVFKPDGRGFVAKESKFRFGSFDDLVMKNQGPVFMRIFESNEDNMSTFFSLHGEKMLYNNEPGHCVYLSPSESNANQLNPLVGSSAMTGLCDDVSIIFAKKA